MMARALLMDDISSDHSPWHHNPRWTSREKKGTGDIQENVKAKTQLENERRGTGGTNGGHALYIALGTAQATPGL
jgi:hypothetical protein